LQAFQSRKVFGLLPEFRDPSSWSAWLVWLKSLFALPLSDTELAVFQKCTARTRAPEREPKESATIVGRRGGKSKMAALVGAYIAAFIDFKPYLSTGERPMVLILARDREQAKTVFGYLSGIVQAVPMLASRVVAEYGDELVLDNSIIIAVKTSDFRAVRGVTVVCAICDEVAFWNFDSASANPDTEVLRALRPAMATIPNAKLILISTGYAMAGVLYSLHREHYGKDDSPVLVWQADTRTMNPRISQEFIDEQIDLDPEAGRSEWGGLFREDISQAFPIEMLEQCVVPGRVELPPVKGVAYFSFDDPMGGRGDFWAKAIAHKQQDKTVVDLIRAWPPSLGVHDIAKESAEVGKLYHCTKTTGDAYAGLWPTEAFAANGVTYEQCEKAKSDLYLGAIPLMSSKRVELPDSDRMLKEFRRLERKRGRGGKDAVQDGGRRDDVCNAVAGAIALVTHGRIDLSMMYLGGQRSIVSGRDWTGQRDAGDRFDW
jgi:hypothetical protein